MKRTLTNLLVIFVTACVIAAAGCASRAAVEKPQAAPPAAEKAGDKGLEQLAKERRAASVADYQKAAALHADNNDVEALSYALQAVEEDGANTKAQALLSEIRKALGGVATTNAAGGFDEIDVQRRVLQRDMTEKFASGEKNMRQWNYADAVADFKEVLRIIRVGRLLLDAGDTEARAKELLKQAEDKKREQDVVEQKKRDEEARLLIEKKIAEKEQARAERLKMLWIEYAAARSQRDYDRARQTLDAIMEQDAAKKDAYLRELEGLEAERVQWRKQQNYAELKVNTQYVMNSISESAVPYEQVFNYGDREKWRKEVLARAEKISEMSKITTTRTKEDADLLKLVQSATVRDFSTSAIITRVGREGSGPDLIDIVNYLKKMYTEIPFDIDVNLAKETVVTQAINLDLPGTISLVSLLNHIQTQLSAELVAVAWRVENGTVVFKRKDQAEELIVRPYDVSDLVAPIQDFKLADVNPGAQGAGTAGGPVSLGATTAGEVNAVNQFVMPDLVELIIKTTGGGEQNWSDSPIDVNKPYIQNYNNTVLYIRQSEAVHAEIETMLQRLRSLSGLLVNIEVRFLTVEKEFLQAVGIDWRDLGPIDPLQLLRVLGAGGTGGAISPDISLYVPGTTTTSGIFWSDATSSIGARINNIVSVSVLDSNIDFSGGTSVQLQILDKISFEAIIHAVRKDSRRQILTAPRITCFNSQQASIYVGTSQTYLQRFEPGNGGVSMPIIDLVDGPSATLDVRPVVSADRRYITLYLRPMIAFAPTLKAVTNQNGSDATGKAILQTSYLPLENKQDMRTVVMVPDGGSVLIGGLKNAEDEYKKKEVPVLGKLPLLGWFFRSEATASLKKELLILVTAKIIAIDEQEAGR